MGLVGAAETKTAATCAASLARQTSSMVLSGRRHRKLLALALSPFRPTGKILDNHDPASPRVSPTKAAMMRLVVAERKLREVDAASSISHVWSCRRISTQS